MLDATLTTQLREYVRKIVQPVELVASLDQGEKSQHVLQLLTEVAQLSELISLRTDGTAARRPSFSIVRAAQADSAPAGITFAGLPLGHEFSSLVLALLQVGGHPVKVAQATQEQIRALPGSYDVEIYFSTSCLNCPDVVQAFNSASVLNPAIRVTSIDGSVFPEEVAARQVMAVPTVYVNGQLFGQGRMSADEILAKLDTGSAQRALEHLADEQPYDVLVVGGGPAGAAAAIYAARKGLRTAIVAQRFGGQVLDTVSIENIISVPHTEGSQYASALEHHVSSYDVPVHKNVRATALIPGEDQLKGLWQVCLAVGQAGSDAPNPARSQGEAEAAAPQDSPQASLYGRTVILAPGARWRTMGVPGEDTYRNKGVTFCPHCDGPLFKGKRVAVIGGGNSGVEAAIDLAGVVGHVTVVEFLDQLRADAVLQTKLNSLPNTEVILGAQTTAVVGDDAAVSGLDYLDRATGQAHHLNVQGIFVQIGLVPNTDWLAGAVELNPRGEIVIDALGATSQPGVFAAGDATTAAYKQIVIATGAGATASLAAFDYLIRQ